LGTSTDWSSQPGWSHLERERIQSGICPSEPGLKILSRVHINETVVEKFGSDASERDSNNLRSGSHIRILEIATSQPLLDRPLAGLAESLLPPKLVRDLDYSVGQSVCIQLRRSGEQLDFVYEGPNHFEWVFGVPHRLSDLPQLRPWTQRSDARQREP
jgi:hypothetical protein